VVVSFFFEIFTPNLEKIFQFDLYSPKAVETTNYIDIPLPEAARGKMTPENQWLVQMNILSWISAYFPGAFLLLGFKEWPLDKRCTMELQ